MPRLTHAQMPLGDERTAHQQGLIDGEAGREYQGGDVHQFVRSYYAAGWGRGMARYRLFMATGIDRRTTVKPDSTAAA